LLNTNECLWTKLSSRVNLDQVRQEMKAYFEEKENEERARKERVLKEEQEERARKEKVLKEEQEVRLRQERLRTEEMLREEQRRRQEEISRQELRQRQESAWSLFQGYNKFDCNNNEGTCFYDSLLLVFFRKLAYNTV
jgi:hypothetical protein